jgi:hypothetical protein
MSPPNDHPLRAVRTESQRRTPARRLADPLRLAARLEGPATRRALRRTGQAVPPVDRKQFGEVQRSSPVRPYSRPADHPRGAHLGSSARVTAPAWRSTSTARHTSATGGGAGRPRGVEELDMDHRPPAREGPLSACVGISDRAGLPCRALARRPRVWRLPSSLAARLPSARCRRSWIPHVEKAGLRRAASRSRVRAP